MPLYNPTSGTSAGYGGTSTTSLAIATGSKVFTTQAGLAYVVGSRVRAASDADPADFMEGVVTDYTGTALTILVDLIGGSGTDADWNLSIAGEQGIQGEGVPPTVRAHGSLGAAETFDYSDPTVGGPAHEGSLNAAVTLATSAAADDIIDTAAAHGFAAGDPVVFTALTGGTGLTVGQTYYVIAANLAATTFQVSTTVGGAAVNFTTDITAGTVHVVLTITLAGFVAGECIMTLGLTNAAAGGVPIFPAAVVNDADLTGVWDDTAGAYNLIVLRTVDSGTTVYIVGLPDPAQDLDSVLAGSSGQDIADALTGAAAPGAANVFATMADVGGGGGTAYGQVVDYPASFSGDTINGSSTTPFVDVAAFDTKEVLNSRVLHLQTLGASKAQRVRVTLGTPKAAAFDLRVCCAFAAGAWTSTDNSTYLEVRGSTSADAQLFAARFFPLIHGETDKPDIAGGHVIKVGGGSVPAINTNIDPLVRWAEAATLRFVRDGSDVITPSFGFGAAPLALAPWKVRSNHVPLTFTVSGTLERIEFAIVTPSGPGATVAFDAWVDYIASV